MSRDAFYEQHLSLGLIRKEDFKAVMTAADREIALKAIAARATGKPDVAATEILAGIAVLDGIHLPILLWPNDATREEKAAWHKAEAAYWEASAQRFAALMDGLSPQQSAEQTLALNPSAQQTPEPEQLRPDSASFAQAHLAAEIGNHPLPQSPEHD